MGLNAPERQISKDTCITEVKRTLIKRKGGGVGVCAPGFEGLKILSKTEAQREFPFLEVIGTNVLANEVVRHFSNLTAKECWELAKRMLFILHANLYLDRLF